MSTKEYHRPQGNPCQVCGKGPNKHRVEHKPVGDPCEKCGLPAAKHREKEVTYIGIDGEGEGTIDHRYTLLAASTEDGSKVWTRESYRLGTEECLDMILELPTKNTKIFAFSFNYDLTKMLTDVDDQTLYKLFRPELRPKVKSTTGIAQGPAPVRWRKYRLNLQGTKFTVSKGFKKVVIWDLFKFFQSKFVNALKDWKVGGETLWTRMSAMKEKRSEFDKVSRDAKYEYCLEECRCMAELARKLVEAHESAELKLRSFYGAGSSGAAMLTKLGIRDYVRKPIPEMRIPVASAFFGGRFENSVIGKVEGLIYNRDISSAYPYHTTFLPCLEHAAWSHTRRRHDLDGKKVALVRYSLGNSRVSSWGPFPFRTADGSISFPSESGGGWIWLEEYLAGERIFPNVIFKEAYTYETNCDCQPFAGVPEYYNLRLRIGKEGPGIVIKLGINSIYGKLAQSVGNAVFNCWIWAGMVTSGCRAQVLDMLGLHEDWSNLLAIATDGIFTREKIQAPLPKNTGTDIQIHGEFKPLGGWEEKKYERGLFFARPGIYFPLNPTEKDLKHIKGRGVGKWEVLQNWDKIVGAWEENGLNAIASVADVRRFCGAKTSISFSSKGYKRANAKDGIKPAYGQWISRKVEMSFHPMPKRDSMNPDGTLKLRKFNKNLQSVPYSRALISKEAMQLKAAEVERSEQPDGDFEIAEDGNT